VPQLEALELLELPKRAASLPEALELPTLKVLVFSSSLAWARAGTTKFTPFFYHS
jgi:hypothetical protein